MHHYHLCGAVGTTDRACLFFVRTAPDAHASQSACSSATVRAWVPSFLLTRGERAWEPWSTTIHLPFAKGDVLAPADP